MAASRCRAARWSDQRDVAVRALQAWPQERQETEGAKPRRLTSTIALPPLPATSLERLARAAGGAAAAPGPRMSTTSTGGSARPSARSGSSIRASAAPALGPRASRCRRAAPPRPPWRAARRPRGRRSAGRPPACRRGRAPRRSRSGPGRRSARRRPSAGRRRRRPRRGAAAPLVVALAGAQLRSEGRRPGRRSRSRKRPSACGVSADLGHQDDDAAAARERRLEPRRGRPRSCPSPSRRAAAAPRSPLAVERAGHRSSAAALLVGSSWTAPARAPTARADGRRPALDGRESRSSRAARAAAAPRGRHRGGRELGGRQLARGSASRTARWRGAEPLALDRAARPAGVSRRSQLDPRLDARPAGSGPGRQDEREAPRRASSSTRARPRARARTSSGGAPASSASIGSASRSAASSVRSASPTTTPRIRRRPKGTRSTCRRRRLHRAREPVVERPAQGAGGGERLDLGDGHRRPT